MNDEYLADVNFLMRNISRDEIYEFAQETLIVAEYITMEMGKHCDLLEECNKNPALKQAVYNVLGLRIKQFQKEDFVIHVGAHRCK